MLKRSTRRFTPMRLERVAPGQPAATPRYLRSVFTPAYQSEYHKPVGRSEAHLASDAPEAAHRLLTSQLHRHTGNQSRMRREGLLSDHPSRGTPATAHLSDAARLVIGRRQLSPWFDLGHSPDFPVGQACHGSYSLWMGVSTILPAQDHQTWPPPLSPLGCHVLEQTLGRCGWRGTNPCGILARGQSSRDGTTTQGVENREEDHKQANGVR